MFQGRQRQTSTATRSYLLLPPPHLVCCQAKAPGSESAHPPTIPYAVLEALASPPYTVHTTLPRNRLAPSDHVDRPSARFHGRFPRRQTGVPACLPPAARTKFLQ